MGRTNKTKEPLLTQAITRAWCADALQQRPFSFIMLAFSIVYWIMIYTLGEEYNVSSAPAADH